MARVLYGSGLRLMECCTIRVKDVDLMRRELTIRQAKGGSDRRTMVPESLVKALTEQIAAVKELHDRDVARGAGFVALPGRRGEWPALGVAVALSRDARILGPRDPRAAATPSPPDRPARRGDISGAGGGPSSAGDLSHLPALVRNAPARSRVRHPDGAGTARAPGCEHDDDLHARVEPWWTWGAESVGRSRRRTPRVGGSWVGGRGGATAAPWSSRKVVVLHSGHNTRRAQSRGMRAMPRSVWGRDLPSLAPSVVLRHHWLGRACYVVRANTR